MSKWIMAERKVISASEPLPDKYAVPNTRTVSRVYEVGEPAPAGHEGRPYTRLAEDVVEARIEEPAPNRMDVGAGAKKRRARK